MNIGPTSGEIHEFNSFSVPEQIYVHHPFLSQN